MATPAGTVDSDISSASGAGSPLSTTAGRPLASTASRPSGQLRRPPSRRTTTQNAPSSSAGRSAAAVRAGLASRQSAPPCSPELDSADWASFAAWA